MRSNRVIATHYPLRQYAIWLLLMVGTLVLAWRAYDLQIERREFLTWQADARQQRTVNMAAYRGRILDRHGEALAISTPVDSIWVNPKEFFEQGLSDLEPVARLARVLNLEVDRLQRRLLQLQNKQFVYIKRHLSPVDAKAVVDLQIPGVYAQREYHRFYPTGEVTAHLLGFTNIDDQGQEGIELAFDHWLTGTPGRKKVIRNRLGQVIADVESIKETKPGSDLKLTIDKDIQYIAYRELKKAVTKHKAKAGSVVVLDVVTGQILAMANQPTFNPNQRKNMRSRLYRNRAVTDVFEPGSTMKPFTVAAALNSGLYEPATEVNTAPGYLMVGGYTINDARNYGLLTVEQIIAKSSNVGVIKLADAIDRETLWNVYDQVGLGHSTHSGFPGESAGFLNHFSSWGRVENATLSYGYGMSVTALQLARAYAAIANDGLLHPISLHMAETEAPVQTMNASVARQVRRMLAKATETGGTAHRARVPGYSVAGKTGTARQANNGGYAEDSYFSIFAGMAPASQPRIVTAVVINDPTGEQYHGGQVAVPVFANINQQILRQLNVVPDQIDGAAMAIASQYATGQSAVRQPVRGLQ